MNNTISKLLDKVLKVENAEERKSIFAEYICVKEVEKIIGSYMSVFEAELLYDNNYIVLGRTWNGYKYDYDLNDDGLYKGMLVHTIVFVRPPVDFYCKSERNIPKKMAKAVIFISPDIKVDRNNNKYTQDIYANEYLIWLHPREKENEKFKTPITVKLANPNATVTCLSNIMTKEQIGPGHYVFTPK